MECVGAVASIVVVVVVVVVVVDGVLVIYLPSFSDNTTIKLTPSGICCCTGEVYFVGIEYVHGCFCCLDVGYK